MIMITFLRPTPCRRRSFGPNLLGRPPACWEDFRLGLLIYTNIRFPSYIYIYEYILIMMIMIIIMIIMIMIIIMMILIITTCFVLFYV